MNIKGKQRAKGFLLVTKNISILSERYILKAENIAEI